LGRQKKQTHADGHVEWLQSHPLPGAFLFLDFFRGFVFGIFFGILLEIFFGNFFTRMDKWKGFNATCNL
jgi:hypothetical protein